MVQKENISMMNRKNFKKKHLDFEPFFIYKNPFKIKVVNLLENDT